MVDPGTGYFFLSRIRTIKPEFPQSETVGKLSRDARLLFIQLFTLADDEGRGRGAAPVLVGALYPYDNDASGLIAQWMDELVTHDCITVYQHDGSTFFQIANWSKHQRIDRPSTSRFPAPGGETPTKVAEKDIEAAIYDAVRRDGRFAGRVVVDVQRQVRVGSSYLDLVIKTDAETFVVEVKRDRMTGADLAQVKRYCEIVSGIPILIGAGLSPKLSVEECTRSGVAIAAHNEAGTSILVPSDSVIECSITFANVTERSAPDLGPSILDLVPKDAASQSSAATSKFPPKDCRSAELDLLTEAINGKRPDLPDGSKADLERQLFKRGKQVLGAEAGGLIKNLVKAKQGVIAHAQAAIEMASTKENPREYVSAIIRGVTPQERQLPR